MDQDNGRNINKFLLDQPVASQVWETRKELCCQFRQQEQKQHRRKGDIRFGGLGIIEDSNMMSGIWKFCWMVQVYSDKEGNIDEVELMITSLYKLIKPEQNNKEAKLSKDNASNLIIIRPR